MMQLLASNSRVVFDNRYPAEYRFLSYFARVVEMMTEPFDETVHVGVTPFFFSESSAWGPIPFVSDVAAVEDLSSSLLSGLWAGWSAEVRVSHPDAVAYAEKLAVDVEPLVAAGIPLRVIGLVRDPRDVLASILAFVQRGADGFGRTPEMSEAEYVESFLLRALAGFERISETPVGFERLVVRYEDLVSNLESETRRISDWLGVKLDAGVIARDLHRYDDHMTSSSAAASIGRWRTDLSDAEVVHIAEMLSAVALPYGYAL